MIAKVKKSYFTVASNTIYQVLGRFVSAVIAVLATRMITGYLGIQGYGGYQIVLTYVSFLWIVTDFGFNAVAVRHIAANPDDLQDTFSSLLTIKVILGCILTLLLIGITPFLPYSHFIRIGILIGSLTVLGHGLRGACGALFQLKLRYDLQFLAESVSSIFFLALVYVSTKNDWGLMGIVTAFTIQYLFVAFLFTFFASKWVQLRFLFVRNRLANLVCEAFPFGIALLFSLFISKTDTFLLSILSQSGVSQMEAVGHYNLGFKLFEFVLAVPVFFMNVIYPMLVKNLALKEEYFKETFKKSLIVLLNLAIWGSIPLYILAPDLIRLFTRGVDIWPAVHVLRNLTIFVPVFYTTALLMWVLVVLNRQRSLIKVYAVGFLFSFTANYLLIPRYSYLATSIIKGVTEVIILLQLAWYTYKYWRETL